jgi:hypothetical protein
MADLSDVQWKYVRLLGFGEQAGSTYEVETFNAGWRRPQLFHSDLVGLGTAEGLIVWRNTEQLGTSLQSRSRGSSCNGVKPAALHA